MTAINALASSARGAVIAEPGNKLLVADLAQMEARILAWISGQTDVLDGFREGIDMYCKDASVIFGHEVTPKMKSKRFVGKVSRLALGYQGGIGAYSRMCESYGVDIAPIFPDLWQTASPEEIEGCERSYVYHCKKVEPPYEPVSKEVGYVSDLIKQRFRVSNPRIVKFWEDIEDAATEAVLTGKPIQMIQANICWFVHKEFLYCRLPNGKDICYPFPKVEISKKMNPTTKKFKKNLSYRYVDDRNQWVRGGTYGGKLTENVVQAIQRELIVDAMFRLDASGYKTVLHIHDEVVSEVPRNFGSVDDFIAIMKDSQEWAAGLPVNANGWVGMRYGKE